MAQAGCEAYLICKKAIFQTFSLDILKRGEFNIKLNNYYPKCGNSKAAYGYQKNLISNRMSDQILKINQSFMLQLMSKKGLILDKHDL